MGPFMKFLKRYDIPLSSTLSDPSKAILDTIALLISWKVVDFIEDTLGEEEAFYFVEDDKKMELEYYKNNVIHFFIDYSFIALSLITGAEEEKNLESIVSDYDFLRSLLSKEFVFDSDDDIQEKVTSPYKATSSYYNPLNEPS